MAFVATPEAVRVCMRFNNQGQLACNVFHVRVTDPITLAILNGIGAFFKNWWDTNLKNNTAPGTSLQAIEVTDVSVEGGLGVEYTTGLPLNGANGTGPLPQNVTVSTKLTSGLAGRSNRGRSYFVGIPQNAVTTDGHITSTFQGILDAAFEALITGLVTNSWPLAVRSLVHNGVPRSTGTLVDIVAASVNTALDSQRRRLPERGA